jgi:O-antigen ligase
MDKELRPQKKIAAIAIGLTAFALLLVIHIRTDLLAAAAGIFVISAYFAFKRASLMTAALSTIILVSVTALFFLSGNMLDLTSFYDRIYYWKVSWALWLDHPVFGVGVSSFQDAYKHKAASGTISAYIAPTGQVFKEAAAYSAHSLILMLLACTGISGFAAFVWLFVKAFQRILSDLSGFRIGLLTWPAVLSVLGITGCNIYHSWYQALFAFFIVLIGSNIGNQNEPQKESI